MNALLCQLARIKTFWNWSMWMLWKSSSCSLIINILYLKLIIWFISPTAATGLFWSSVVIIVSIIVSVVVPIIVIVSETLSLSALSYLTSLVGSPLSLTTSGVILTNDKKNEKTENEEVEEELHDDDGAMDRSLTQAATKVSDFGRQLKDHFCFSCNH